MRNAYFAALGGGDTYGMKQSSKHYFITHYEL